VLVGAAAKGRHPGDAAAVSIAIIVNAFDTWRDRDFAPLPGTPLCSLDAVPDGRAREFQFGEGRETFRLLVLRTGERVFGYVNKCPHFGVPLNVNPDQFTLFEHTHIYCCVHYAMFRFEDGLCEEGPCVGDSLTRVPLSLDGGNIRIAQD
jgi:nitrite reductase/ring-hydroxylating ferredoxin subunit